MEAIKVTAKVGKDGVHIAYDDVAQFENSEVEILIFPSAETKTNRLQEYAGLLSSDEAKEMEYSLNECRKIDMGEW